MRPVRAYNLSKFLDGEIDLEQKDNPKLMKLKTYMAIGEMVQAAAHAQGLTGPIGFTVCRVEEAPHSTAAPADIRAATNAATAAAALSPRPTRNPANYSGDIRKRSTSQSVSPSDASAPAAPSPAR